MPSAKGHPAVLEEICRSLSPVAGVSEVTVNETIGTITVLYDPKRHIDFHDHLSRGEGAHRELLHLSPPPPEPPRSEVDEAMEMLEKEAEFLAAHSHGAQMIFDTLKKFDAALKKATDNNVDLRLLAPLGLAAYAFLELGFEVGTPVWLTLSLFSFNHFLSMHTQPPPTHPSPPYSKPPKPNRLT